MYGEKERESGLRSGAELLTMQNSTTTLHAAVHTCSSGASTSTSTSSRSRCGRTQQCAQNVRRFLTGVLVLSSSSAASKAEAIVRPTNLAPPPPLPPPNANTHAHNCIIISVARRLLGCCCCWSFRGTYRAKCACALFLYTSRTEE